MHTEAMLTIFLAGACENPAILMPDASSSTRSLLLFKYIVPPPKSL